METSASPRQKRHACHKPKRTQCSFVFLSQRHCSSWVSWTKSNSELVLSVGNIGRVTWGCSSERTWNLAWCLDLTSWQCPCSWRSRSPGVLGQTIGNEIGPSRFGPVRLLAIPKTEDRFEGPQIFRHCRHSGTCDDHPEEHSSRGVPEMFWPVETPTH
jgi:hypothetical protein